MKSESGTPPIGNFAPDPLGKAELGQESQLPPTGPRSMVHE
jgi:hypothetical protein